MVGTRHCCWGECKTDSRYPEKWPELLKELEKSGQKVFIPFPKPAKDLAKCKRWLVACSREFFTEKNVNKNTYICALHWPVGKGPSDEFPDPLKANLTPKQAGRASAPKRKAPKPREEPVTKQNKVIKENYGEQSDEFMDFIPTDDRELLESSTTDAINESTTFAEDQVMCDVTRKHVYQNLSGKLVSDQEPQTVYSKYELSAKVYPKDSPWMSVKLKELIRMRQQAFHANKSGLMYKYYRNAVNKERKRCKAKYYASKVKDLKCVNPRQWWSEVNKLSGKKKAKFVTFFLPQCS